MSKLGKFETIKYDFEEKQYYISCRGLGSDTEEKKPLSAWGFCKSVDVCVIVKKNVSTIGKLEQDVRPEFYVVPIKYAIEPRAKGAKDIYLKLEKAKTEEGLLLARVSRKDVNMGYSQLAPMPNALYDGAFQELTIKKGKGKLITTKQAATILKSGTCLGLYDQTLTQRLIS